MSSRDSFDAYLARLNGMIDLSQELEEKIIALENLSKRAEKIPARVTQIDVIKDTLVNLRSQAEDLIVRQNRTKNDLEEIRRKIC